MAARGARLVLSLAKYGMQRGTSNISSASVVAATVAAVGQAAYGAKEFFTDFFTTDIMNHCVSLLPTLCSHVLLPHVLACVAGEFLKYIITQLGKHDESLLEAILEQLAQSDRPVKPIKPFYRGHQNLPKNPVNIASAYVALKTLRIHSFNIYEQAFLDGESQKSFYLSLFTISMQWAIFVILLANNLPQYTSVLDNFSPSVWILALSTTFFFGKACYDQYTAAAEFKDAFTKIGRDFSLRNILSSEELREKPYLLMLCSTLGNQVLAVLIPFFNIYFILLAESPNDAVLNSLALFFVLELDEMVVNAWDEGRKLDELAINAHDFIMQEPEDSSDALVVTKCGSEDFMSGVRGFCPKSYPVYPRQKADGSWSIVVYHRASNDGTSYDKNEYIIAGAQANHLIDSLKEFECFHGGGHYGDIHD